MLNMNEPILKTEASARQRANYLEAGLETEAGLEEAIRLLQLRRGQELDAEDCRRLRSQLTEIEAEREKVHADLISFLSETFRFMPPSVSEVNEIKDATRVLYSMVADDVSIEQIMHATHMVLNRWSRHRALRLSA
jgi:hypothetical protein